MPTGHLERVATRIDAIFDTYRAVRAATPPQVVPREVTNGKVYEAWVLCKVLERLTTAEHYRATLRDGQHVVLKSSGGPINRAYPHFELTRGGGPAYEVWTDVEFLTLSYSLRGGTAAPRDGDFHELDVVVVPLGIDGRPRHDQICIGVECKNTGFPKQFLRAILGVRRELSYFTQRSSTTTFRSWPRHTVFADPPSCLLVYTTDSAVNRFSASAGVFGIDVVYEPLPS